MSQWEKLLARLHKTDTSLRYEELKRILEHYGYTAKETRGGSSHITFRKAGCNPITIPRHNPIKRFYVEIVRDAVMEGSE